MAKEMRDVTLQYDPFGGRVSIYLMGNPLDWSISGDHAEEVGMRLAEFARYLGIGIVLAPRPAAFNAKICETVDLTERALLAKFCESIYIYRGCNADGVVLPFLLRGFSAERYAFWLSSADCITIVAHDPETGDTIPAHGGRDCLLDRSRINGGPSREYESVVHSIAARFSKAAMKRLKVFMTCGIGPEHFEHRCDDEKYGPANTKMVLDIVAKWGKSCLQGDYLAGKIVLSELIRAQLVSLGVHPHNIGYDTVDTFSDRDRDGSPRWWSYRRGDGKKRNGVLVVRNW